MALSTAVGTWYLRVRIPEKEWLASCGAGREALDLGRFNEAERHFLAAVEAARAFGAGDRRLARSQFLLAQALVGQARKAEALRLLEISMAIYSKSLGRDHAESARVLDYYTSLRDAPGSTSQP
jgi:tetratricopeptide (TPR) repeat protein